MGEFQEFADALFGQLSVEINEEKEIVELATKARDDIANKVQFKELDDIATEILPDFKNKVEEFVGIKTPENISLKFPELEELKRIKGNKVFADNESKEFSFSNGVLHIPAKNPEKDMIWWIQKLKDYDIVQCISPVLFPRF